MKPFDSEEAKWEAVVRKDPDADGCFWFSVATTGVYCRPSCASRPALRKNVRFHASPAKAEAAGFRPCKRCRPDDATPLHAETIAKACRRIEAAIEAAEKAPSLAALARTVGLSPDHFHRLFKAATGLTPKAYADAHRAGTLRRTLPKKGTVTEALYAAGFNASSRFYEAAPKALGMAPSAFRDGGKGETIRFAHAKSSLGTLLAATTEKGLCFIALGDAPAPLERDLRAAFPKAARIAEDPAFAKTVARLVRLVEEPAEPARGADLPLDIRGTAFQHRVWQALREIPAGKTESYSGIAVRLGMPKAARAVARACATNSLALVVPCHRVVGSGGALSGYRWGVARKQALLEREARRG